MITQADPHFHHDGLLSRNFLWLKILSTAYVLGIPLSHFALPHGYVWEIAVFFLIAMLFTYPAAAIAQGTHIKREILVSLTLAGMGILGLILSQPILIVLGIFGHGCWDLAKHYGAGCTFFKWYVNGCVIVDWSYAAALTIFLLTNA